MRGTVSEPKIERSRSDWFRFTVIMLAAVLFLGNAARFAGQQSWISMALTLAGGLAFIILGFMTISANPRVRQRTSWDALRSRETGPR
jgi:hypothetical protein